MTQNKSTRFIILVIVTLLSGVLYIVNLNNFKGGYTYSTEEDNLSEDIIELTKEKMGVEFIENLIIEIKNGEITKETIKSIESEFDAQHAIKLENAIRLILLNPEIKIGPKQIN